MADELAPEQKSKSVRTIALRDDTAVAVTDVSCDMAQTLRSPKTSGRMWSWCPGAVVVEVERYRSERARVDTKTKTKNPQGTPTCWACVNRRNGDDLSSLQC